VNALEHCFVYGILDLGYLKPEAVTEMTKKLVRGGIDLLQLRAKEFPLDEVRRIGHYPACRGAVYSE
jgi:thiamine-phosphate pyrophosphorylase